MPAENRRRSEDSTDLTALDGKTGKASRQNEAPVHPHFDRVCARCGLTFGSHRGDNTCRDQCPEHEGRMDWATVGVTTFVDSGELRTVEYGTERIRG